MNVNTRVMFPGLSFVLVCLKYDYAHDVIRPTIVARIQIPGWLTWLAERNVSLPSLVIRGTTSGKGGPMLDHALEGFLDGRFSDYGLNLARRSINESALPYFCFDAVVEKCASRWMIRPGMVNPHAG